MPCKKLITLAAYIHNDENALICDYAEYYHVYDFRRLPARYAAILASGLRAESRSVMAMSSQTIRPNTQLLINLVDELQIVMYQQRAVAGSKHNPKPTLIMDKIKEQQTKKKNEAFDTPEEFWKARERILKGN